MSKIELTEWYGDQLVAKTADVLEALSPEVYARSDNQITSDKWSWDRVTRRKNGKIVSSPRDIVDLGTLRNSASTPAIGNYIKGVDLTITWSAPYAYNVATGKGQRGPARNWIQGTYAELSPKGEAPFITSFIRQWNSTQ